MAAFAPSYLHLWLVSNHLSISTYIELDGYETKQSYIIYEFVGVWILILFLFSISECLVFGRRTCNIFLKIFYLIFPSKIIIIQI